MTQKRENHVTQNKSPESVGDILAAVLKVKGYDKVCKEWETVEAWSRIAGGRVAEVTECGRVDDGVLYVKVMSAPWRQELSYLKDDIKKSIVRETGCETIRDIVFY